MCLYDIGDFFGVSSAHGDYQGNAVLPRGFQYLAVPQTAAFAAYSQPSQFVGLQDVDTGYIKHEVRLFLLDDPVKMHIEQRQVFSVPDAVRQGDVQR